MNSLMTNLNFLKFWFLLAMVITAMSGLVYLTIQQSIRYSADDPQIQIAEDIGKMLDNGRLPADFNTAEKTDITKSLGTYLTIYDTSGKPVVGTGVIGSDLPTLPIGVFQYTKAVGEDRITWQPLPEVRSALVVVSYKDGFVAVGRSMREIEIRESRILQFSIIVWLVNIFFTFIVALAFQKMKIFN